MKREKRNALLQEFIERDFTLAEILDVLSTADIFCEYRKKWLHMPREYEATKIGWQAELERTLEANGLDFTPSDFIDED